MNCSSPENSNSILGWRTECAPREEAGTLHRIRQLLVKRAIDLDELGKAISAVPRFAFRLRQMVSDSGAEYANVNDVAVLAGRYGILSLLDQCSPSRAANKQPKLQTATRLVKL